jgi:prophage maintenance system killer protein
MVGVIKNHPFFEGIKRTELVAAQLHPRMSGGQSAAGAMTEYQSLLSTQITNNSQLFLHCI